ncbi:MAG TPA: hypothetical protein VGG39_22565 [Polyangiaceae bacterium]|jgi:hypothetical protein
MPIAIPARLRLVLAAACVASLATGCVARADVGGGPRYVDPHAGEHHEDHPPAQRQEAPRQDPHPDDHHSDDHHP